MLNASIFRPPAGGTYNFEITQMLQFGKNLREEYMWKYPILPGAIITYVQLASSREVKVSASTARAAAKAVDWLNEAVCYNLDGTKDYGFSNVIKRRCLDYTAVGRTAYHIKDELEYIDPTQLRWVFNNGNEPFYQHMYTNRKFRVEDLIINHPLPIGDTGFFMPPLMSVIPTAILAWLVREHDKASIDGRKIRDIFIVGSKEMSDSIQQAVQKSLEMWAGAKPESAGVPVIYMESIPQGVGSVADMITRMGISAIPDNFDRSDFEFKYVNEIAAALGIALRQFWNSERATNRALEEIQDARQVLKGPSEFVRNEQRLLNAHAMKRFGRSTRMGFIEEVDSQTKEVNAKVLKMYSDALLSFAKVFGGQVNSDAFLSWLQSEDILPADIKLITETGTLINPDTLPTTGDPMNPQMTTTPNPSALSSGTKEKSVDALDYGEITMDSNYNIIDKRNRMWTVEHEITSELEDMTEKAIDVTEEFDFYNILAQAHEENHNRLKDEIDLDPVHRELADKSLTDLTDEEHRLIAEFVNKIPVEESIEEE